MILPRRLNAQDAALARERRHGFGQVDFSSQQIAIRNDVGGGLAELAERGLKQCDPPVVRIADHDPSGVPLYSHDSRIKRPENSSSSSTVLASLRSTGNGSCLSFFWKRLADVMVVQIESLEVGL